jgi:hypothetical protein
VRYLLWITGAAHRGLPDDEMVDFGVLRLGQGSGDETGMQ